MNLGRNTLTHKMTRVTPLVIIRNVNGLLVNVSSKGLFLSAVSLHAFLATCQRKANRKNDFFTVIAQNSYIILQCSLSCENFAIKI